MDERENTAQELEKTLRNTARTGKSVARAAGKAAEGNAAGAAFELLKDEGVRKTLAVILALLVFLTITVMYIFPMAVYEGIQTVFQRASEEFSSSLYSGEGGNMFKAVWSFASSLFSSLWEAARSAVSQYRDPGSSLPFYTDIDGDVVSAAEAPAKSVYEKVEATKEKYDLRRDAVKHAIKSQASSAVYDKAYSSYCASFDEDRDVFNGFVWDESGCLKSISDLQAIKLMALYATLTDNDFSSTRLADYLKWLGYKGGENSMIIDVFGTDVTVEGWTGTFMPRYLTDEAATSAMEKAEAVGAESKSFSRFKKEFTDRYREEYETYTSRHGAPALDFLIKAYVSSTLTPAYQTATRKLEQYSGIYKAEDYRSDTELMEIADKYRDEEEGFVSEHFYTETEYRTVFYSKGETNTWYSDREKQDYYASTHGGKRMPYIWQSFGSAVLPFGEEYVDVGIYQNYKIVTYTAYINIVPRKTDELVQMCGLISGKTDSDKSAA